MILLNKNIGTWIKNTTYIEDVAYDCYCEYRVKKHSNMISTQYIIVRFSKMYNNFYLMAEKRIRHEKLKKLNEIEI